MLKVKGGKEVEMAVGVSKHIKTDVILGHDVPHFRRYLSEAMKAETWEIKSITVKSDVIPPTPTTTEFALAMTRGQERVRAQQEKKSSTQQALDKPIIHTLEPSGSGCEVEGCPEDGAAEEGVSPRKEKNPSPNNKLSTPPSTEEENVDDLDEENNPGHGPPQESVAEPELVLDSTSALTGEQNIFDTISANQLKEETISHLNSDLGRAQVKQEELQKELDKTSQKVIELAQRADALGKDNRQITKELKDMDDMKDKELEKVKESLQERLRLADVEIVGKDGIIHNLTEARDMLQCEVVLVSEAKECVEKELEDAKCKVAVFEAEVQSSIFKNREKDILVSDSMESQNSLEDQHAASLAVKDREIEKKEEVVKNLEDQIGDLVKEFGVLQTNFQSLSSESGTVNNSIAEKDHVIAHLASLKD